MVEIITHDKPDCILEVPEGFYQQRLPRTASGLYALSDGDVLPESRLLDVQGPSEFKRIEINLRSFYLLKMMDLVRSMSKITSTAEFRWKGRGIDDFESEYEDELAAVFAAACNIAENAPSMRAFNKAFILFHLEFDKDDKLIFNLSLDSLARFYIELRDDANGRELRKGLADTWNEIWGGISTQAIAMTVNEKKLKFIAVLEQRAQMVPEGKLSFAKLMKANCYNLWS